MKVKDKKGFTLAEVIMSVLIVAVIVVAGLIFHVPMKRNVQQLEWRFTAINLASSQIEELKERARINYLHPNLDAGAHSTTLHDIPADFTVTYFVENKTLSTPASIGPGTVDMDYKQITVTCGYGEDNQLDLIGFMMQDYS